MGFAVAVIVLRYAVLPRVGDYKDELAASLARGSGMKVSIASLQGGWDGLRPRLALDGVRFADRRNKPVFQLEQVEASLSWWSLLVGEVLFSEMDFYRPDLVLRRDKDGLIYLADRPLNQGADSDGAFLDWLLEQPRLRIHDAALTWKDELAGAPEVRLSRVEFSMQKDGRRHRLALSAVPPAKLSGPIQVRAALEVVRDGPALKVGGEVYADTPHADVRALHTHLPIPSGLRAGVGAARAWVVFEPGDIKSVTVDLSLSEATAQLREDLQPLTLRTLVGRLAYRDLPGGFEFSTKGLKFRSAEGNQAVPSDFLVSHAREHGIARGSLKAHGIDLKVATALMDYFPLPPEIKASVRQFAPRGLLRSAGVDWSGESLAKATSLRLDAEFEGLGVNAVDRYPGVTGLSGTVVNNNGTGRLAIAARDLGFDAPHVFRAPLAFATLAAKASWKPSDKGLAVEIEHLAFDNADIAGTASGKYRTLPGSASKSIGWIDLEARVSRANLATISAYLPNGIEPTRQWLDRAVTAGRAEDVRLEARGDLWHFPFAGGKDGKFLVQGKLSEATLKYLPEWPSIDRIKGSFEFAGSRMEIRADDGLIFASKVSRTVAVVADLGMRPSRLDITGAVDTTGADSLRFLRESPLAEGPGSFTRFMGISGPAHLDLKLGIALGGKEPVRVNGDYRFGGATATLGKSLALTDLRGVLGFTEKGVSAPELVGSMFGNRAVLKLGVSAERGTLATLEGRADASALGEYIAAPFAGRLAGAADWRAVLQSRENASDLRIDSDLKGIASTLVEPFAKAAEEARVLVVTVKNVGQADAVTAASLDNRVFARLQKVPDRTAPEGERLAVAVKFGSAPEGEPVRAGLWLYGAIENMDYEKWRAQATGAPEPAGAPAAPPALELRGLDLRLAKVRYARRDYEKVAVRLERQGRDWKGSVASPEIEGEVAWNDEGRGKLTARMVKLALREETGAPPAAAAARPGIDLPALDVVCERFEMRGKWLGRLEIAAAPAGEEWRIDRLNLTTGHATFASSGSSRPTAAGPITSLNVKLSVNNLNALFNQFGYGDYLKRGGESGLEGRLAWPGLASEFALGQLSGSFRLYAEKGQFSKIQTGAGKLLGLISLQAIPRVATLDFGHIFSDGFAYDSITANVNVARGILLTNDFEISGPAAFVSMAGEVSLPEETQNITLRVVPEFGESAAIAATLLGTPVLGLSTLLVSKLLKNPLGRMVAYEYAVTGSWDNPAVTNLGPDRPPPVAKAPAAADIAK